MDPTGHYWFNLGVFLKEHDIRPVLVNPHHVKKSKELDDNSQSKNDRKDPKVIAGLVKDGRFTDPFIPEGVYADLRTGGTKEVRARLCWTWEVRCHRGMGIQKAIGIKQTGRLALCTQKSLFSQKMQEMSIMKGSFHMRITINYNEKMLKNTGNELDNMGSSPNE